MLPGESRHQMSPPVELGKSAWRACPPVRGDGQQRRQRPLCATTHGDSGVVAFIADDEASAQTVPGSAGTGYLIRPVLTVRMQNQPGIGGEQIGRASCRERV